MGQLELTYVSVMGWIIDPDVYGLLDGHGDIACLPTHYGEIAHTNVMTRGVTMVINGKGTLRCFLNLSPKVLADSPMYYSSHFSRLCLNL